MLKTRNGKETQETKQEPKLKPEDKSRQEAEAAQAKAKQEKAAAKMVKEAAARAQKEAEAIAKERARQEKTAARERALQAKKAEKTAKIAAAWVKKELAADAKRKAKQEAEAANMKAKEGKEVVQKAQLAAAAAKKEAEAIARKKAQEEAEAVKKSQQAAEENRKAVEAIAKEKARKEAEAVKESQMAAAAARKEAEALAREKTRQEAEALKEAQMAAATAKKEAEELAREKARQEAEALKQAQQATALAKKEAEESAKEKAKQEAEALKQSRQAAAMAIREAEAIAREKPPQRIEPVVKAEAATTWVKKETVTRATRIPFFSGRSIMVMLVGLIIGTGLGLGYWIYNPFASSPTTETTQPSGLQLVGLPSDVPWSSQVKVQMVNPGSSYVNLRDLASTGQYYAAKASSLPFLQFLSDALKTDAPQYNHTVDELDQMITATIDTTSEQPTMIITTTAATTEEASFFSTYLPGVFTQYLIAEEGNKQQQAYTDVSDKIQQVKAALVTATDELNTIKQQSGLVDFNNDPVYVALTAKISALETQLNYQATTLAANIEVSGASGQTVQASIDQTIQQRDNIVAALSAAEAQLNALALQITLSDDGTFNTELVQLNAKVSALEIELNRLMVGDATTVGLVTMIAQGMTESDPQYATALNLINQTSESLVKARQDVAVLQSRITDSTDLVLSQDYLLAQAKVDNLRAQLSDTTNKLASLTLQSTAGLGQLTLQQSFDLTSVALTDARSQLAELESSHANSAYVSADLDYQLAQAKVDTLTSQLGSLTASMTALVASDVDTVGITDSLVAGNPSIPVPVLPEKIRMRNALMIGAILGIVLAWGILNWKWIRKSVFAKPAIAEKEDEL
ncbi:MAG: hypothetical protein WC370_06055 [Dehalococcoidales bacterium]|jgi:hypothetical protein